MKTTQLSILLFSLFLLLSNAQDTAVVSPEGEAKVSDTAKDSVGSSTSEGEAEKEAAAGEKSKPPVQSGPWIDLLGPKLVSLNMIDETHAQVQEHYTNEALAGKKVIGLYFSADWCGPCRQFTPELVNFYKKMNARKGKEGDFEIVWISRCRDANSFGQYFTQMNWLALPSEEALGRRGSDLSDKMKVKGIPHLVLLDEVGNVITYDARTKIPTDRAGIGFPWRNPVSTLINVFVPKSLRLLVKDHVDTLKAKVLKSIGKK